MSGNMRRCTDIFRRLQRRSSNLVAWFGSLDRSRQHFFTSGMDTRTQEQRHRIMAAVKGRHTGPELAVRRLLFAQGFRYRLHVPELPGRPDIVLPRWRVAIFVHGCFWHGHGCSKGRLPRSRQDFWADKIARNRERDRKNSRTLRRTGWRVLVVWQCELRQCALQEKMLRFIHSTPADAYHR
jgi:DNA mismatch endonuclease (patch repair protein)